MRRARGGLTLVELLVVIGLLSAFTYMAFRLLSGGISIWRLAEESRDQEERARVVLDLLRADLAVADGSPGSRFVVDHAEPSVGGEPHLSTRLRFVRTISRAESQRLRAGLVAAGAPSASAPAGAGETFASAEPRETKADPFSTRPPVGLLEVAYACAPDPASRDGSAWVLRRAFAPFEPEAGDSSIFARDYFERAKGGFADRAADVAGGVLHFGVLLVSQRTARAAAAAGPGGLESSWDSTRHDFCTTKGVGPFRFSFASDAPLSPRERVYPRRVQVMLVLEREDPDRRLRRLDRAVDSNATEFRLDDPRSFPVPDNEFLKVGGEWVVAASADAGTLRLRGRGALGTRALPHAAGLAIHRGRVFRFEIPLDCARDAEEAR